MTKGTIRTFAVKRFWFKWYVLKLMMYPDGPDREIVVSSHWKRGDALSEMWRHSDPPGRLGNFPEVT